MKLLLLSNSTMPGQPYLSWPLPLISDALKGIGEAVFIPYAAVTFSYDDYEAMVNKALAGSGIKVKSIHHFDNPEDAVMRAEALLVGGGNTFKLLKTIYDKELLHAIRLKVREGVPYIGWSAGSNLACPSIKTTNDMPVVEPLSFDALQLVKFQINPHYTEKSIEGHGGESRLQRLLEYSAINHSPVLCLPEGCAVKIDGEYIELIAGEACKLIHHGGHSTMLEPGLIKI